MYPIINFVVPPYLSEDITGSFPWVEESTCQSITEVLETGCCPLAVKGGSNSSRGRFLDTISGWLEGQSELVLVHTIDPKVFTVEEFKSDILTSVHEQLEGEITAYAEDEPRPTIEIPDSMEEFIEVVRGLLEDNSTHLFIFINMEKLFRVMNECDVCSVSSLITMCAGRPDVCIHFTYALADAPSLWSQNVETTPLSISYVVQMPESDEEPSLEE